MQINYRNQERITTKFERLEKELKSKGVRPFKGTNILHEHEGSKNMIHGRLHQNCRFI